MAENIVIWRARVSDIDILYEMGIREEGFELSSRTRFYS